MGMKSHRRESLLESDCLWLRCCRSESSAAASRWSSADAPTGFLSVGPERFRQDVAVGIPCVCHWNPAGCSPPASAQAPVADQPPRLLWYAPQIVDGPTQCMSSQVRLQLHPAARLFNLLTRVQPPPRAAAALVPSASERPIRTHRKHFKLVKVNWAKERAAESVSGADQSDIKKSVPWCPPRCLRGISDLRATNSEPEE